MSRVWLGAAVVASVCTGVVAAAAASHSAASAGQPRSSPTGGIHLIKHVIVIMQENRSFDSYFGTFPGADGIPKDVCVPDPARGGCVRPYHDTHDRALGGPHGEVNARRDINAGAMNGFVREAEGGHRLGCRNVHDPNCTIPGAGTDVMGWHDRREIPNYWDYARNFVLQDHMFEPNASWSLPSHLFMVSGWSAKCAVPGDAWSCVNALQGPVRRRTSRATRTTRSPTTPGPI